MPNIYFAQPMRKQDFYPNEYYHCGSGHGSGGGGKQPFSKIVLLVLAVSCIVGFAYGSKQSRTTNSSTEQNQAFIGKANIEITDLSCSEDGKTATVQAIISNSTAHSIFNIQIVYTITDGTGATIAEKEVSLPNILLTQKSITNTETLDLPDRAANGTLSVTATGNYQYSTF